MLPGQQLPKTNLYWLLIRRVAKSPTPWEIQAEGKKLPKKRKKWKLVLRSGKAWRSQSSWTSLESAVQSGRTCTMTGKLFPSWFSFLTVSFLRKRSPFSTALCTYTAPTQPFTCSSYLQSIFLKSTTSTMMLTATQVTRPWRNILTVFSITKWPASNSLPWSLTAGYFTFYCLSLTTNYWKMRKRGLRLKRPITRTSSKELLPKKQIFFLKFCSWPSSILSSLLCSVWLSLA